MEKNVVTSELISMNMMEKLTGVSQHTLRSWERRHRAVEPSRSESGRRMYSMKDVERIRHLAGAVANGHSIGLIARLNDNQLQSLQPFQPQSPLHSKPETEHIVSEILRQVEAYSPTAIDLALTRASAQHTARDFIINIVAPLLGQMGFKVSNREMNVAQEHLLSGILRTHLGRIYQSFLSPPTTGPLILFAAPEGNLHEFGILLAAILASMKGCRTYFLGANLPLEDLLSAAEHTRAKAIVIGAAALPVEFIVRPLSKYFSGLDRKLPLTVEVWLGGDHALENAHWFKRRKPRLMNSLMQFENEVMS